MMTHLNLQKKGSLPSSPAGFDEFDKGIESSCCVRSSAMWYVCMMEERGVVGERSVWHFLKIFTSRLLALTVRLELEAG